MELMASDKHHSAEFEACFGGTMHRIEELATDDLNASDPVFLWLDVLLEDDLAIGAPIIVGVPQVVFQLIDAVIQFDAETFTALVVFRDEGPLQCDEPLREPDASRPRGVSVAREYRALLRRSLGAIYSSRVRKRSVR